jgi:hypothetical protein
MHVLLITTWLFLPLAPLNPIEQDTLASMNLHLTVGIDGPNGILSVGPVVSSNWELLVVHPFMVRGLVEGSYSQTRSKHLPKGHLWTVSAGADAIYYRGTDRLMGYLGGGVFYASHFFSPFATTSDSLLAGEGITDIEVKPDWGYRIILGLRHHRVYSLELVLSELRRDFRKIGRSSQGIESRAYQPTRTGNFRITFGYLFEI